VRLDVICYTFYSPSWYCWSQWNYLHTSGKWH